MEGRDDRDKDEIYANVVRAGKRTYFFDVRETRGKDYYLTITESKRQYNDDGTFHYQKHKIFLYKEDFEKFTAAFADTVKKVVELKKESSQDFEDNIDKSFTDIDFSDLGSREQESND